MLNLIFCVDNSGLFGRNNGLPWYFKEDLKYFKDITTGGENHSGMYMYDINDISKTREKTKNIIVMGYNTWNSLKNKLPNRINVVISANYSKHMNPKTNSEKINGTVEKLEPDYVFKTFDDFLCKCKINNIFYNKTIFIIGGKKLLSFVICKYYKYINNIFATVINHSFPQYLNDTVFKLSTFTCLELSKNTTNVLYCNNYNDNKLYSLNFIHYKNSTFNSYEVNNYINNINTYNPHNNYTLLNEMSDVNLEEKITTSRKNTFSTGNKYTQICKECGNIIEYNDMKNTTISGENQTDFENDKTGVCNTCLYSKCKCIFC